MLQNGLNYNKLTELNFSNIYIPFNYWLNFRFYDCTRHMVAREYMDTLIHYWYLKKLKARDRNILVFDSYRVFF